MDNFNDKILFQTRQHKIVLITKFIKLLLIFVLPLFIISYFVLSWWLFISILIWLILSVISFLWVYFFWSKSYFLISNKKISIKVRNGLFSEYHMSIYFKNIKDIAYSKNNILNYLFDYWTLFARSSAWSSWDFEWPSLPKIETIYKYINNIYLLSEEKRDVLDSLENLNGGNINLAKDKEEQIEEIIKKEKEILLNIVWVKEVVLLEDKDRSFIFENEEDRNHWVYEVLRKSVLFVITHDFSFREPDEAIVLKKWDKVVFPTVKFHEIDRDWVLSASPWIKVHDYLRNKFENLLETDATILVGFDI